MILVWLKANELGCIAGEVIGAVAAGGAKIEQDVMVAQAALAALGTP